MILILKHTYYGPPVLMDRSYNYEITKFTKKLLFYHYEDIENYVRNNIVYTDLVSLEIERVDVG